jgi:hypothetical protein
MSCLYYPVWPYEFTNRIVSDDYSIYSKHLECRIIKYRLNVFSLEPNFAICCIEYQVCPFVLFSFDHCVVCSPSIYGFWISFWYLQTLLLVIFYIAISINLDILTKGQTWYSIQQIAKFGSSEKTFKRYLIIRHSKCFEYIE